MASKEDFHHRSTATTGSRDGEDDLDIELTRIEDDAEVEALVRDDTSTSSTDPHERVALPGTASKPQVAMNIVISFVGAGILGVPDAFRRSGWLLGSVTLLVVSFLNVYAMLLLPQVKAALVKKKQTIVSYGDVGRCILGTRGETFVNVCLGIAQAGFATAYIIFIAANLFSVAHIPRGISCAACVPGLACLVQFRDMKHLSPFSTLANFSNFCALCAVLLQDYESFRLYDSSQHDDIIHPVRWDGFLHVVAITIYSMEGIGLILSLEASCQDQASFPWLLRFMLALITLFMVFFGTAGYWAFGDNTLAPITLNLVDHFWSATFVKCALCLGLYLTYPIMMFPIWAISERMSTRVKEDKAFRTSFRSSLVVMSSLVAYAVPDFGNFLSLVGSSICIILGFVLPCYFHLTILRDDLALWQIGLDGFLLVGGALFGLLGTYNSFCAMWKGELEGHG